MRRNEFESRFSNWENRQLVAVITPKYIGRTALRVQWAGLDEIREAAAFCDSWASSPEDDQFFDTAVADAEVAKAFDEASETPSDDKTDTSSTFDKVEDFIEAVVTKLNKSSGTLCFGFPNGDFMVATESAGTIDQFSLIGRTIEAINDAWKPEIFGELGWERPSIYVNYSGKP